MIDWLWQLDLALTRLINTTWSNPVFDTVLFYIADVDTLLIPLVIVVVLIAVFGQFRGRLLLVTMLLALILGDAGTNWAFKIRVNRPRPHESVDGLRVVRREGVNISQAHPVERGRSFTSGHACNNLALALVATAVYGLATVWWIWPWAFLISYSRIYTADHFPSDVLGSWVIAAIYTLLILRGMQWLWDAWGPTYVPELYRARPRLFLWGRSPSSAPTAPADPAPAAPATSVPSTSAL